MFIEIEGCIFSVEEILTIKARYDNEICFIFKNGTEMSVHIKSGDISKVWNKLKCNLGIDSNENEFTNEENNKCDLAYVLLVRDLYDREFHIEGIYKSRHSAEMVSANYSDCEIREEYLFD